MIVTTTANVNDRNINLIPVEVEKIYDAIKTNEPLKEKTTYYRLFRANRLLENTKLTDEKLIERNKKDIADAKSDLPAMVAGALFIGNKIRQKKNIERLTGVVSLDFDHVENIDEVIEKLKNDNFTMLLYRSPSEDGIKVLVEYNTIYLPKLNISEQVRFVEFQLFNFLKEYYKTQFNLDLDEQTKDVTRACFLCNDDNVYFNNTNSVFDLKPIKSEVKRKISTEEIGNDILDKIYSILKDKNIALDSFLEQVYTKPKNRYNNWIEFGWFLRFLYNNNDTTIKKYFHLFSALDNDYNEDNCENTIIEKIESYKANVKNYKLYYSLMVRFCEKNLGLELTADERKEVKQDANFIVDYIKENIIVKQEVISEYKYITYKYKDNNFNIDYVDKKIDDNVLSTIFTVLNVNFGLTSMQTLRHYLYNENIIRYNKVVDYLEGVRTEDDTNLNIMIDYLGTVEGSDIKHMYIKNWMMGVFSNLFQGEDKYKHFLIIKGTQSIGKTTFVRDIFLKNFVRLEMLEESFHFSTVSKDDLSKLYKKLIIFDDDLSASTKQDIGNIKKITSQLTTDFRKSYGYEDELHYRIASFIGCSNEDQIYNDFTGGARFLVLEMNKMIPMNTWKTQFTYEFMDKVWGFMYNEYKKGERWNTPKYMFDYTKHNEIVEQSRIISTVEEHLTNIIQPVSFNEQGMTLGEIISKCNEFYPDFRLNMNQVVPIAKILKNKLKIISKRPDNKKVWQCRVINNEMITEINNQLVLLTNNLEGKE